MKGPFSSISFCMSTNGRRPARTRASIRSIYRATKDLDTEFEVIVAGVTEDLERLDGHMTLVEASRAALSGQLARVRNIAAERASHDVILFMDDDIVFPADWLVGLQRYCRTNHWDVLGNRVLLPDGSRYWDRATISPHQLVDYDHPENDPNLYQTGCFWLIRKDVFELEKWDESIVFYSEKNGGVNEDIEYSRRLTARGYVLAFDKENYVWHWDDRYTEWYTGENGLRCIRKDDIVRDFGVDQFPAYEPRFQELLDELGEKVQRP